ncbi:enolase C-terminal domain-like protein [Nitratireductor sp. CH_MIT9313-5]|jgi:glucarate dehydratase|uniref:enolase C-terminal domain-like protein n=1 Tax=Nitratireductor sp. CH_MIT9313-5 TaxID=3107764 RepID=UPI00300A237A
MQIQSVRVTPIAVPDVPIRNLKGTHQQVFLRSIIEVECSDGSVGLSETYGAKRTLSGLQKVASSLVGLDIFDLNRLARIIREALPATAGVNAPTALADHKLSDVVYSAYEVALLDLQGKYLKRPVCDLLGGAVRDRVPFGGYLFYKFAKPEEQVGTDLFGEVLTPDALVEQAQHFVDEHGFKSLKLKGGVLEPELEVETLLKLKERFPGHPLRIDPMGAWTPETALKLANRLEHVLEYLEDPSPGMDGMAAVGPKCPIPLATNLVVVEYPQIFEAVQRNAVQIILSDHHYWRGMTGAITLGRICDAAGLGVAMHSNSHLGISLAAMVHVAAATPNLTYDCDTHYPWVQDEVIKGGTWKFKDGSLPVPTAPGLGVELDHEALSRLHALYQECGVDDRDDLAEIRKYIPDFERLVPRW